jgi:hypothetical protein
MLVPLRKSLAGQQWNANMERRDTEVSFCFLLIVFVISMSAQAQTATGAI